MGTRRLRTTASGSRRLPRRGRGAPYRRGTSRFQRGRSSWRAGRRHGPAPRRRPGTWPEERSRLAPLQAAPRAAPTRGRAGVLPRPGQIWPTRAQSAAALRCDWMAPIVPPAASSRADLEAQQIVDLLSFSRTAVRSIETWLPPENARTETPNAVVSIGLQPGGIPRHMAPSGDGSRRQPRYATIRAVFASRINLSL